LSYASAYKPKHRNRFKGKNQPFFNRKFTLLKASYVVCLLSVLLATRSFGNQPNGNHQELLCFRSNYGV